MYKINPTRRRSITLKLFVDDLRNPPSNEWILARDVDAAVTAWAEICNNPKVVSGETQTRVSLDYHLAEGNIRPFIDMLISGEYEGEKIAGLRWPDQIGLHTSDLNAAQEILELLDAHKPEECTVEITHVSPWGSFRRLWTGPR